MRLTKERSPGIAEGDMTPMIDMTFQLIAFFMVLVNFSDVDQNQAIRLPLSELAKPPDGPLTLPITLQVSTKGFVMLGGDRVTIDGLKPMLLREKQVMEASGDNFRLATIIIRGDRKAKTGEVQKVIRVCQETGFEKFALRAKQSQEGA